MLTPTPYLDGLLLASAAYPSGFGHSLFVTLTGRAPREASPLFLGFLALPYAGLVVAVLALRPELFAWRAAAPAFLALALAAALAAFGLEWALGAWAIWRRSGRRPRGVALTGFWGAGLGPLGHGLLVLIAIGEELVYRQLWLGTLLGGFGWPAAAALGVSSLAYGLNHLAFGPLVVASKAVSGLVYGGLYLAAGGAVWVPIVAHVAQNALLFGLSGWRRG